MDSFINHFLIQGRNSAFRVLVLAIILAIVFYKLVNRWVLESPAFLWFGLTPIIVYFIFKLYLRVKNTVFSSVITIVSKSVTGSFVLLLFYYVTVISGFNICSFIYSKGNAKNIVTCEIVGATASMRNHAIWYKFAASEYRIGVYGKEVAEMAENGNYDDYILRLSLRKGLWQSEIIDDWELFKMN